MVVTSDFLLYYLPYLFLDERKCFFLKKQLTSMFINSSRRKFLVEMFAIYVKTNRFPGCAELQ